MLSAQASQEPLYRNGSDFASVLAEDSKVKQDVIKRAGENIAASEVERVYRELEIAGLETVFPRGAHWPKRGRVTVTFGKPLLLSRETPGEIVDRARKAVEELS